MCISYAIILYCRTVGWKSFKKDGSHLINEIKELKHTNNAKNE